MFSRCATTTSKKLKNIGNWIEIDRNKYSPIEQFVVVLNEKSNSANIYKKFLFSDKSKKILKDYGY